MKNPVLAALDVDNTEAAVDLARRLAGAVGGVKVGKEFFTSEGPEGVRRVVATGAPVFTDLKFHDIPNTVAGAVRAAVKLKPLMLNIHAGGGADMMRAAVAARDEAWAGTVDSDKYKPILIAVTVLTSLSDDDLRATGVPDSAADQVRRLAGLAAQCGCDGVVCSPREIETLRADLGATFKLVVPGVRPNWASRDDQKRVMTPEEAVMAGADWLVIGRPITKADDPRAAAERIAAEIGADIAPELSRRRFQSERDRRH